MEILQIKNLNFSYPDAQKSALCDVSLSVAAGEFIVICGESGCGKSTLLRLIKRELSPYGEESGDILYNGVPMSELDERTAAADIGFVLQDPEGQIVTDTVWHELAFGAESLGLPQQVIRRRVAEMASYFGIEGWFHKKTSELSGGQKQLLNLAAVMVMQPKILLLDEPTAQLDPIAASDFIATLQKLNRELGLTVLLVEHRLEEVFPIADKVWLMERGAAVYSDSPNRIGEFFKAHPSHPMIAGLPAAMRIFGALEEDGAAPLTVREGRKYITEGYENRINAAELKVYIHSEEKAVELKNVWFRYGRELPDVMRDTTLEVYTGEHFCILGGNGAGKTTVLGIIAGVLKPYRGKVMIYGKRSGRVQADKQPKIALLPQDPQTVFTGKTVREELEETCRIMKIDAEEKIAETAERLGISHLLQMHPYDLSGGERQKAALAKLLLLRPEILLLDEPTKGIDPHSKLTLSEMIGQLKADGITVITVTHDVEFAAANADRCGLFFDGELISADTPTVFFSENNFYTTAANRISRGHYKNAILCEDVAALCRLNEKKRGEADG